MASINERFMDFQIAQQVRWIRLGNRETKEALRILRRVDKQLEDTLRQYAIGQAPFTQARLEALRAQVTDIINTVHRQGLGPHVMGAAEKAGDLAGEAETGAFKRIMPAGVDVTTPNPGVLQNAIHSRPFNGAVMSDWVTQLRRSDLDRSWRTIVDGITSGRTTDDLIRDLVGSRSLNYKDGVREVSRRGTQALVRTSINHATNQGRQMAWEANQDLIKGIRWVSTLDGRTTPICRDRDGDVGPVVDSADWEPPAGADALNPPLARPPAHVNCRSTTVAVTKSWRELGFDQDDLPPATRASMDGKVPAKTTYYEWLGRQSAATQKEVLGKTRYELWQNAGVAPQKFVNDVGEQLTIADLRKKMPDAFKQAGLTPTSLQNSVDAPKVSRSIDDFNVSSSFSKSIRYKTKPTSRGDGADAVQEFGRGLFNSKVGAYANIQGYLRQGKPKFAQGVDMDELRSITNNLLKEFDNGFVVDDFTALRGVKFARGDVDPFKNVKVGDIMTERGLTSTTTSRKVLNKFTERLSHSDTPYELHIKVPKGSRALARDDYPAAQAKEAEIMLPPGKFRVVDRKGNKIFLEFIDEAEE